MSSIHTLRASDVSLIIRAISLCEYNDDLTSEMRSATVNLARAWFRYEKEFVHNVGGRNEGPTREYRLKLLQALVDFRPKFIDHLNRVEYTGASNQGLD